MGSSTKERIVKRLMRGSVVLVLAAGSLSALSLPPAPRRPPRLVVLLVVDQMRTDYIHRYQHQWTGGLRRLVDGGAWYSQAAYPYLNTVTCTGHATISTGTFPSTHGMVLNGWWDRDAGRTVSCTEDAQAQPVSYGGAARGGHSPARLQTETLADAIRTQSGQPAHVVTMSLKPRSAIMLAGRRGDSVLWFDDTGGWVTSTAFTPTPVPFVQQFVKDHPLERDAGKIWTRALHAGAYLFDDDGLRENPPQSWVPSFPHPLGAPSERGFYLRWAMSPFADEYLGRMAAAAVDAFSLGRDGQTDLLGVSFSTLDSAGHRFGPRSHEVQDVLVRLDRTLGVLLDHLDKTVGAGEFVLALSADHGVAPIPEQMTALGLDAGRLSSARIIETANEALRETLGAGKHVVSVQYTDLYFAPGIFKKLQSMPDALTAVMDALRSMPGVASVYRGDELQQATSTDDASRLAAMRSYYPGRSGDLIIVPRPYWIVQGTGTTHGTANLYDRRVPLVLYGRGVRAGEYLEPATPADLAPTLAFLSGVTLPRQDGRVLVEALAERKE
jgi:predicted AlkP superfamily pyrophosphatase or phosphodiesterase